MAIARREYSERFVISTPFTSLSSTVQRHNNSLIFLSSKLAPHLIGPIAIAAYSYMALVPIIQPPFMKLIVSKKERLIRMKPPRAVSKLENEKGQGQ